MNLVIVESPTKAKIIQKYLNKLYNDTYHVIASKGHICALDEKHLSIDIDENAKTFTPKYVIGKGQEELVKRLKKLCKNADTIWLASDMDREGEAIAYHIKTTFAKELKNKTVHRVMFNEITQDALTNAFDNPGSIDYNLVQSQECRRILDRLVGYKLSPILWNMFPNESVTLSAGRVQSAALHLLLNREKEINNTLQDPSSYWFCKGTFKHIGSANLFKNNKQHVIDTKVQTTIFLKNLFMKFSVNKTNIYESTQSPELPLTTSALQQAAYNRYKFSPKKTMQIAQNLYEMGKITYMRTDSTYINPKFQISSKYHIINKYGNGYVTKEKKHMIKSAHEAIRPTNIEVDKLANANPDEDKLYGIIYNRTLGFFMENAKYKHCDINIIDEGFESSMYFHVTKKLTKFNGFMILYGLKNDNCEKEFGKFITEATDNLEKYGDEANIEIQQSWSNPPPHYNEAMFIKNMEKLGIGRPSTYSSILTKLYDKKYIEKKDVKGQVMKGLKYNRYKDDITHKQIETRLGEEKDKIVVSILGSRIDQYLEKSFDYIVDSGFTSNMEAALDSIASSQTNSDKVLWTFWDKFKGDLKEQHVDKNPNNPNSSTSVSREVTIKKNKYIIRTAKYGPVIEHKSKKEFISLTPYMKYIKKSDSLDGIDDNDVCFLTSLPYDINKTTKLCYGAYGFYLKQNGFSKRIDNMSKYDDIFHKFNISRI